MAARQHAPASASPTAYTGRSRSGWRTASGAGRGTVENAMVLMSRTIEEVWASPACAAWRHRRIFFFSSSFDSYKFRVDRRFCCHGTYALPLPLVLLLGASCHVRYVRSSSSLSRPALAPNQIIKSSSRSRPRRLRSIVSFFLSKYRAYSTTVRTIENQISPCVHFDSLFSFLQIITVYLLRSIS
jgi:hypothetical protein